MEDIVSKMLELAADNDTVSFRNVADPNPSIVDETGTWYVRQKGSNKMILETRTPLMIASTYGSLDVVKFILSNFKVDVKKSCGHDNTTALHCAASGGSMNAIEIVELLLAAGANPASSDKNGRRPFDVIVVSPHFQEIRHSLDRLLNLGKKVSSSTHLESKSESALSRYNSEPIPRVSSPRLERRAFHNSPSLPDMRYGIYATDDFRMYRFKIVLCARSYSHDWTDCPFIHPGENARRRDPRKYNYIPVPCPVFRNGACDKGDACQYSHGVFECWLHPDQYRTRICKDGGRCERKVCFFAHTRKELRPMRVSRGSGVLSPINYVAAKNYLRGTSSYVPKLTSPTPYSPLLQTSFGVPSLSEMSTQSMDLIPPMALMGSTLAEIEKRMEPFRSHNPRDLGFSPRDLGFSPRDLSFSSRDLGSSSSSALVGSSINWTPTQKPIWGETSDSGKLKRSPSFESSGDDWEEPDLSWVKEYLDVSDDDGKGHSSVSTAASSSLGKPIKVSYTDDPLDPSVMKVLYEQMEKLDDLDSD